MLIHWLFWLLVPGWNELILNPATGKISQKNLFGVMGFYVGTVLTATIIIKQLIDGKNPDWGVVSLLTANGLGLTALKIWQNYQNRQTATDAGQPLAAPLPPGEVPPIMPQIINPNAPANEQPQP
jgi:hypothetical protein